MRIGITGASCSGKTQLCIALANTIGLPIANEGAREAATCVGISSSQSLSLLNSERFQIEVLANKIMLEDIYLNGFISDRTVIDCAVYFLLREKAGIISQESILRIKQNYFERIGKRLRTVGYDAIVILEYGRFGWVNDGFRSRDDHIFPYLLEDMINHYFKQDLQLFGTLILRCPIEIHDRVRFICESLGIQGVP